MFMHLRGGGAGHRLRVEQDTVMRIFLSQCLHLNTNKRKLGKYKKKHFLLIIMHFRFTRPFFVTRLNEETAFHFVFVCSFFRHLCS